MNRRTAISMFGRAMTVCAGWCHFTPGFGSVIQTATSAAPAPPVKPANAFEAKLQAEMDLLGKRVYSEEGIPMLLACEDLTAKVQPVSASKAMNALIASAFHRYTDAWQRLHPHAPVGDVAKLVELLAYKDFAGGGKDTNL